MKKLKHKAEAMALRGLFALFRALPMEVASALGGAIARAAGPFLSAHRTVDKNLRMIFPDWSEEKYNSTRRAVWDNLGRVAAELPHLGDMKLFSDVHVIGVEHLPAPGKAAFMFSGHFGNWELLPAVAAQNGTRVTIAYRTANNPLVDRMIADIRATRAGAMFPKGRLGAMKIVRAIKNNEVIAMLVDQKMNDGIAVPFFGRDAMTAPAIADLALRFDMPIVPSRVIRKRGAHFEAEILPPLIMQRTGDHEKDVLAIMKQINDILESWIRECPEQWFWVHKRWPKDAS